MKLSTVPFRTSKNVSADLASINARLLTQAAFVHQEIAGVYTFLPFGLRVLSKIEDIIRKEMDLIASEVLMASLAPKSMWEKTGRISTVDVLMKTSAANEVSLLKNDTEYILGSTHEEMVTPLIAMDNRSYKDFPIAVYQIQTKFRNEPRAKSGLLRCREFRMKDLYSFHASQQDLMRFYEAIKTNYLNVYAALGIGKDTYITYASGGDFTTEYSHEFQTVLESGEDTIYLDRENRIAYNKEITTPGDAKKLGVDFTKLESVSATEVGNIFPLQTKFSKAIGYTYTNETGEQKPVYMGCYGIGSSRLMAVIAEKFADSKGLVWPKQVAPFLVHLIDINSTKKSQELYTLLQQSGIEVLFDDRETRPGEKFADADLIGIPVRLVVSAKTGEQVEWKERTGETSELISTDVLMKRLEKMKKI